MEQYPIDIFGNPFDDRNRAEMAEFAAWWCDQQTRLATSIQEARDLFDGSLVYQPKWVMEQELMIWDRYTT